MTEHDPPPAPRAAPPRAPGGPGAAPGRGRTGRGCLWAVLALPVVLVGGLVLGTVLAGDDGDPETVSVTLERGTAGGGWRVDAQRDVEGDLCTFLYVEDRQLTGACGAVVVQDATLGGATVVFGRIPGDAPGVQVALAPGAGSDPGDEGSPGSVATATTTADGLPGRWFVVVVDHDVDVDSGSRPVELDAAPRAATG